MTSQVHLEEKAVYVGTDWKGTEKWQKIEQELKKFNCDVVYIKHTDGISSTILREVIEKK